MNRLNPSPEIINFFEYENNNPKPNVEANASKNGVKIDNGWMIKPGLFWTIGLIQSELMTMITICANIKLAAVNTDLVQMSIFSIVILLAYDYDRF